MSSPLAIPKRTAGELVAELKRRMRNRKEVDDATTVFGNASTRGLDWLNEAQLDLATRMRHFDLERVVDSAVQPSGPLMNGISDSGSATSLSDSTADFTTVLIGQILFNLTKNVQATVTGKSGTTMLTFSAVTPVMASGDTYQLLTSNDFCTLPNDLLFLINVSDLTNRRRLEQSNVEEIDESFQSSGTGNRYARYANGIMIDPPYDAYANIRIRYQRLPKRLSLGDVTDLNIVYEKAMLLEACAIGYEALLEPERAMYYRQLANNDLASRLSPRGEETLDAEHTIGLRSH